MLYGMTLVMEPGNILQTLIGQWLNMGNDKRLTIEPAGSDIPSISVSGSDVHVVWRDTRDGNRKYITNTHRTVA